MAKLIPIALLCLCACSDAVDRAAKRRIFSPEDPPQAVAAASERLPAEELADAPAVARRVLGMSAAEATERIGAHRYQANISWEWSSAGRNVRLKEFRELVAAAGGVSGDFQATLSNTNNLGLEVIRVGGAVYARSSYGKDGAGELRQRLRDRGMAERMRSEAFGALRDFDELFFGRLKLSPQGTTSFAGRTAWKYSVSLAPAEGLMAVPLPPRAAPKDGLDAASARRDAFYARRLPRTLQGEILVDATASVAMKVHLDGRMAVASEGAQAELRLVLDSKLSGVGTDPHLAAPRHFLPDQDKPEGIAAALARFGFERDGGTGSGSAQDIPDEGE